MIGIESVLITMKKTGILTYAYSPSFGAMLQCYALRMAAQRLAPANTTIEIIPFAPPTCITSVPWYELSRYKRLKRFSDFRRKFLEVLIDPFRSLHDLEQNRHYDQIIVGSDQVWNPGIREDGFAYFLPGVFQDAHKDSYAASFGVDEPELIKKNADKISSYLAKFRYISVREESGIAICSTLGRNDACEVMDPTFLLEPNDYQLLLPNTLKKQQSSVVCGFFLKEAPFHEKLLESYAKKLGCPARIINSPSRYFSSIQRQKYTTIPQFVETIKNARFVVTDSFHALAFSIIFQREFIVIPNIVFPERATRITNLLKLAGLTNRIVDNPSGDFSKAIDLIDKPIEYKIVNEKLASRRNFSLKYLEKILQ